MFHQAPSLPLCERWWLKLHCSGVFSTQMRPEKLLQCIKCNSNSFSLRYFCVLILFARAWSSSLSLEIPRRSPKSPKYLLDRYSSYPRRITSSDCTLPPFPYMILQSRASLIICPSSDVSTSSNRAQGPVYKYPHHQIGPKAQYTNLGPRPHKDIHKRVQKLRI